MSTGTYYSLRSHSPYQGTIQVVELDGFRALSRDGVVWRVRLRTSEGQRAVHSTWQADRDNTVEMSRTQPGFDALRNHPATPFPLIDTLELWLLDAENALPLALLRSLPPDREPPNVMDADWIAGFRDEESFYASSLAASGHHQQSNKSHIAHTEVLTRCVRAEAGMKPKAQWFYRRADGSGIGSAGLNLEPGLHGRPLEATLFPKLLLREKWEVEMQEQLVEDYHHWQSPYFLTHTNLSRDTRLRLEQAACQQAERLYSLRHLLPEIIDKERVEAAMVEAVIRRTAVA
jgi:hypothetical protein